MNVLVTGANSQIGCAISNRIKAGKISDDYIFTSLHPKESKYIKDFGCEPLSWQENLISYVKEYSK